MSSVGTFRFGVEASRSPASAFLHPAACRRILRTRPTFQEARSKSMAGAPSSRPPYQPLWILGGVVLVVATLYWAQSVLIPVALALLLAFILTPAVAALQRRGFGRVPAVLVVAGLVFALLAVVFYVVFHEVSSLIAELPNQSENIKNKLASIQGNAESVWHHFQRLFQDLSADVHQETQLPAPSGPPPIP